jgi:hypothetical protein
MFSPFGSLGRYLSRAVALAGVNKVSAQWFYDPMITSVAPIIGANAPPWISNRTAVIGTTVGLAVQGGVQRLSVTGAAGAGFSAIENNANGACMFTGFGTSKWYFCTRARSTTGVTATEGAYSGITDGAGAIQLRVGLNGRASTAFWTLAHGAFNAVAASVISTVAVDTNFHDFEMWCVGNGNINWAIDGVTQTALAAPAVTDGHIIVLVEIAAADVTANWDTDDICAVWESAV